MTYLGMFRWIVGITVVVFIGSTGLLVGGLILNSNGAPPYDLAEKSPYSEYRRLMSGAHAAQQGAAAVEPHSKERQ